METRLTPSAYYSAGDGAASTVRKQGWLVFINLKGASPSFVAVLRDS
jgi:hypothetical protein